MKSRFLRLIEFSLYFSGPLVALVTTPIVARALGPDDRGAMGVALTISSIAVTIGVWGAPQVILADLRDRRGTKKLRHIAWIGAGIASAATYAAGVLLGLDPLISALAGLGVLASTAPQIKTSYALAADGAFQVSLSAGLSSLLRLFLLLGLFVVGALTLESTLAVQFLALLLGTLVLVRVARTAVGRETGPERSFRSAIAAGAPVVGFSVLTAVTLKADVLALQLLATPNDVGVYAAVVALAQASLAASAFFRNRIQSAIAGGGSLASARPYVLALACLVAIGVLGASVLADPVCDVLFGSEFVGAPALLRVLAFTAGAQMFLDVGQGLLISYGLRRALLVVGGAGAVCNVVLLATTVPVLGAVGAALSSAAAAAVGAAISFIWAARARR